MREASRRKTTSDGSLTRRLLVSSDSWAVHAMVGTMVDAGAVEWEGVLVFHRDRVSVGEFETVLQVDGAECEWARCH